MKAQHTPGPWTYDGDHTHRQFNIRMLGHLIGTKDEAKHICTVNNLPSHVLANRNPATAEANARLISESPAMLEALRDMAGRLRLLSDSANWGPLDEANYEQARSILDRIG